MSIITVLAKSSELESQYAYVPKTEETHVSASLRWI
jgi:hypothetical protein